MFPITFVVPEGTAVIRTSLGRWAFKQKGKVIEVVSANSPVWKNMKAYRGKTKIFTGTDGKQYYGQWDKTHGNVEVYTMDRKHVGAIDPIFGKIVEPPIPGRTIEL